QEWLNPKYLNTTLLQKLAKQCHRNRPFPHLVFSDFLQKEKADQLLMALMDEDFEEKKADLFQLKQTADLISTKNLLLKQFRSLLASPSFVALMSFLSSSVLQSGTIDISGSLYEDTNYLLCHDDLLENRKVAFFYYLSNQEREDGGALSLFSSSHEGRKCDSNLLRPSGDTKGKKSEQNSCLLVSRGKPGKVDCQILPKFNTFAFFIVSKKSFHQVEEMVTKKERYALSGWYRGN
ncbi:2OG-Fe(II) oxygenase, partial [Candidatus Woesearchaeota archaeon]|nr:2OG-Fe(II) oxygenase [Candidatus Woesearchaeota archaeon]